MAISLAAVFALGVFAPITRTPGALSLADWGIYPDGGSGSSSGSTGSTGSGFTGKGGFSKNSAVTLNAAQQQVITGFMDTWYDSLATLTAGDVTPYFVGNNPTQSLGNQTALEVFVSIRKLQSQDLTMTYYTYALNAWNAKRTSSGDIMVKILENCSMNFREYPGVESQLRIADHSFILTQQNGEWRIKSHDTYDSLYDMVMGDDYCYPLLKAMKNPRETYAARKKNILQDAYYWLQRRNTSNTRSGKTWQHDYDRQAAVKYAQSFAGKRNSNFPRYDYYGGNCQNYVSQCLAYSGIPMDYQGNAQWKYYGPAINSSQNPTGRSSSWGSVIAFQSYVQKNTGYGLVGQVNAGFYTGEIGDVILMGTSERWRHSVIITGVLTDGSGQTKDYLINSNTADLRNMPASAYWYGRQSLVRIYGWNGAVSAPDGEADDRQPQPEAPGSPSNEPESIVFG